MRNLEDNFKINPWFIYTNYILHALLYVYLHLQFAIKSMSTLKVAEHNSKQKMQVIHIFENAKTKPY